MVRVLIFITAFLLATVAHGAPLLEDRLAKLDQPSQTATIETGTLSIVAFYRAREDLLDLTLLVTDQDGETLRTRVALRDRQHHALTLADEHERQAAFSIEILRTGDQVEMMVRDVAKIPDLAAR